MSRFPEAIKRTRHTTRDLISLTLMLLVSLHTGLQQAGMGELTGSPTVPTVHFLTSNTGPNSFNEYSPYSTFQTFWVLGLCSEHKSIMPDICLNRHLTGVRPPVAWAPRTPEDAWSR